MTQLTRQELYDKIKETSKEAYTLKEMKRLGYWKTGEKPKVAQTLMKRKKELQQQINTLSKEVTDPKAMLKAIHKQRMADARQQRVDTKVTREVKRYQRAVNWYQRQQGGIEYLGDACIIPLADREDEFQQAENKLKLAALELPRCLSPKTLAAAIGITLNELRFLCYTNEVSKVSHYQRFAIQKKTGGVRLISAPMPRLKRVQYWILDNILKNIPLSEQAHGFVPAKSIVTNAEPHSGKKVVINLDLNDFFPTISFIRIQGLFKKYGYNREVSTLLALLCSEPETETIELDGQRYYIQSYQRFLPQGAPTSPNISNIICRHLDKRLQGLATKYDFTYTRYADDLTFSSNNTDSIMLLLKWVNNIVTEEGFKLHPDKTRIMRQGTRQEVTGIVVNDGLSVNRKQLKRFRAVLFQIKKDGYENKQWGKGGLLLPTLQGYAHFVKMVNPKKGIAFLQQIKEIIALHGYPESTTKQSNNDFRRAAAIGQLPLASMQVAQPPSPPDIHQMIQHTDVHDLVCEALDLPKQTETTENKSPDNKKQQRVVGFVKSLFRRTS
ncbi:MAG: RNA-directed DNA polymerase [Cocleimonas sp.]|nr:RNA-directed DNA polymerase [Cocleimonas sp.]